MGNEAFSAGLFLVFPPGSLTFHNHKKGGEGSTI